MTACTPEQQPKAEWFANSPSLGLSAAILTTAKLAAALQNLHGNCCAEGFGILMYHRLAENVEGVRAPTLNVTPKKFRHQLAGLLARGFECWPLSKLVAAHHETRPVPANVFAVTFDDGYENNYVHAWPILRELNVPATIFLATKYLDTQQPFPFDNWSAAGWGRTPPEAWRPMTSAQCDEMLADDDGLIEFGAHTHSHRRFLRRSGEFHRDLQCNLDVMRDRFGITRPAFAFPYGEFCREMIDDAKRLEVTCAVTTKHRRVLPSDDVYQWGRYYVGQSDSPAMLAAKLSGWYSKLAAAGKKLQGPLQMLARARNPNHLPDIAYHQVKSSGTIVTQQ